MKNKTAFKAWNKITLFHRSEPRCIADVLPTCLRECQPAQCIIRFSSHDASHTASFHWLDFFPIYSSCAWALPRDCNIKHTTTETLPLSCYLGRNVFERVKQILDKGTERRITATCRCWSVQQRTLKQWWMCAVISSLSSAPSSPARPAPRPSITASNVFWSSHFICAFEFHAANSFTFSPLISFSFHVLMEVAASV